MIPDYKDYDYMISLHILSGVKLIIGICISKNNIQITWKKFMATKQTAK